MCDTCNYIQRIYFKSLSLNLYTVDGFIFMGTNFRELKKNQTFVGIKICGHSIFLHTL